MEKKLRHIRLGGNLTHAGVEMLPNGNDIPSIIIKSVAFEEGIKINGRNGDAFVATFAPNPYTTLPMILNSGNKKLLCKLAGKDEWHIEEIENFPVRLTREKTPMGWGLRISKQPPMIKDVLTEEHKNWGLCIEHIKKGGKVDDLRVKYEISPATEIKLKQ